MIIMTTTAVLRDDEDEDDSEDNEEVVGDPDRLECPPLALPSPLLSSFLMDDCFNNSAGGDSKSGFSGAIGGVVGLGDGTAVGCAALVLDGAALVLDGAALGPDGAALGLDATDGTFDGVSLAVVPVVEGIPLILGVDVAIGPALIVGVNDTDDEVTTSSVGGDVSGTGVCESDSVIAVLGLGDGIKDVDGDIENDGTRLGKSVDDDGLADKEGLNDGAQDGIEVDGDPLGIFVGAIDGDVVGRALGETVGRLDGEAVSCEEADRRDGSDDDSV
jgi:hypothetical protein